ncbi:MAG: methyltransferase domain-containing protein [Candidatus ainarchaeum sp.]|nr:methyltransferase domain-containing protein [Candidatus ainarchaeum sp.]
MKNNLRQNIILKNIVLLDEINKSKKVKLISEKELMNIMKKQNQNNLTSKNDLPNKSTLSNDSDLNFDLKLEIASGNKPKPGFIHFDVRKNIGADVLGDVRNLPFKDNTFSEIYSRFLLEHLSRKDAIKSLSEIYRVLKNNGTFEIIVPDLKYFCKLFISEKGQLKEWALNKMYGFENYDEDHHFFGYDEEILTEFLKYVKFTYIKKIDDEEQYLHLIVKKVE